MEHLHDSPEAISYMLADNKLTEKSDWNYGKLETNFNDLKVAGFDVTLTGFDDVELKEVETKAQGKIEVEEDDFDPESVEESIVQPGDIWQLGNHRLMCGDSTKKEDVETLMDGNKVDLLFTSPPYNCGIDYDVHDDSMEKSEYLKLINDVITTTFTIIKEGRFVGWNVGVSPKTFHHEHLNILLKNGFKYHRQIVWVKSGVPYPVFSSSKQIRQYNPNYTHEMIYFVTKGEPIKGDSFIPKQDSEYANDVWKINQTQATSDLKTKGTHQLTGVPKDGRIHKIKEHPAPYPTKIPAGAITHLTNKGENIIDPFGGTGSSLLAAEQLNRNCFVMEMSASYCDIIIRRWEDFTGQKAELIES